MAAVASPSTGKLQAGVHNQALTKHEPFAEATLKRGSRLEEQYCAGEILRGREERETESQRG